MKKAIFYYVIGAIGIMVLALTVLAIKVYSPIIEEMLMPY